MLDDTPVPTTFPVLEHDISYGVEYLSNGTLIFHDNVETMLRNMFASGSGGCWVSLIMNSFDKFSPIKTLLRYQLMEHIGSHSTRHDTECAGAL